MKSAIKFSVFLGLTLSFLNCSANAALLYDITFSEPYHALGEQINTDNGPIPRYGPSEIFWGSQIVRTSFGPLTNRPAEFLPELTPMGYFIYSQIQFDISVLGEYPKYKLDFELCIENMPGEELDNFSITYDVPSVVRIDFENDGTIKENRHIIGYYDFGDLLSMSILVDLPKNTWSISCNAEDLYTGQFFYPVPAHPDLPTYISSIRFNLSDDKNDAESPHAAIDNIKIYGIPEPGTVLILGLGALFIKSKR